MEASALRVVHGDEAPAGGAAAESWDKIIADRALTGHALDGSTA
jgi:hypothetical protein